MVTVVTGEVCIYKYCGVYDSFLCSLLQLAGLICFICSLILDDLFTGSVFYRIGQWKAIPHC